MTNSSATYNRSIVCDLPDYPAREITFKLLTYFAAAGTEALPTKVYTLTLDGAGQGTQVLPVPDNTGEAAWLWRVELPDENKYLATLAYSASSIQLTAWLVSAVATVTAASIADQFVLKDGDTMTGQLNFSGTTHAGIKHISLTTAERDALTPVEGMEIYNETTSTVQVYQGGVWVSVGTGGAGAVDSVFGRTGVVIAATSDYDAVQVDVTPAGNIAATNVQAAIEELDSEKEAAGTAAGLIATHNADTTAVHGIADTSILLDENDVGIMVQSFSVKTASIVSAIWGIDKGLHFTGSQAAAIHSQTAFARTILDDPDAATVRATIGAEPADATILKDADIGVSVQAHDADTAKLDVAQNWSAAQNMQDNELTRPKLKDYGETVNAIGSIGGGTQDIDLTLGNVVSGTVDTSTTTFTFSNPSASGTACSFTLFLTNGGSQTVNWPASVDWASGTPPTLTAAGIDVLTFVTLDGGTTWYGFPAGLNMG